MITASQVVEPLIGAFVMAFLGILVLGIKAWIKKDVMTPEGCSLQHAPLLKSMDDILKSVEKIGVNVDQLLVRVHSLELGQKEIFDRLYSLEQQVSTLDKEVAVHSTIIQKDERGNTIITPLTGGIRKLMLIVDDNEAVTQMIQMMLSGTVGPFTLEVVTASKADEAMVIADGFVVDVAIVDLSLKTGSTEEGIAVVRYLKRRNPDTEIIILSGHVADAMIPADVIAGGVQIVEKPASASKLQGIVEKLLRIHHKEAA